MSDWLDQVDVKLIQNALWSLSSVHPPAIVPVDILHNIHLGVQKNMMEWVQGFLGKHKRLAVFDKIWSSLPPYSGFTHPRKQYRQITMWSGTEMRGVGRVILACFTAAMFQEKDGSHLSPAAKSDLKVAFRAIHALLDFCLIAQYRSHTAETIKYMSWYLQDFHKYRHVFGEFCSSKANHKRAKGASKDLAASQARQSPISNYFPVTPTQKANVASTHRQEQQDLVKEMLGQSTFNYPKLHLLTYYTQQIVHFWSLPQYSTEITEALHKPLKDAYRRSNSIDAPPQILDSHDRESACRMLELVFCAWRKELNFRSDIKDLVAALEKDRQNSNKKTEIPVFEDRQKPRGGFSEPLTMLGRILRIPNLVTRIQEYLRLKVDLEGRGRDLQEIGRYWGECFHSVVIPALQFQGPEIDMHYVRWTGGKEFRKMGDARVD